MVNLFFCSKTVIIAQRHSGLLKLQCAHESHADLEGTDSDYLRLEWGLRLHISTHLPGDISSASPHFT